MSIRVTFEDGTVVVLYGKEALAFLISLCEEGWVPQIPSNDEIK